MPYQSRLLSFLRGHTDVLDRLVAEMYVRTTNLIEQSFLEERRRTKVIPRFFDERSCLKLAYATLVRASQRWQRIRITDAERVHLLRLRQELGLKLHQFVPSKRHAIKRSKKRMVAA